MSGVVDDIGLKERSEEAIDISMPTGRSEACDTRDLLRVCLTCRLTNATPLLQRRQKRALGALFVLLHRCNPGARSQTIKRDCPRLHLASFPMQK
jgi:hypothetical protein